MQIPISKLMLIKDTLHRRIRIRRILRYVGVKVREVVHASENMNSIAVVTAKGEVRGVVSSLYTHWPNPESKNIVALKERADYLESNDLYIIESEILPNLEDEIDEILKSEIDGLLESIKKIPTKEENFCSVLHQVVISSSYRQFQRGLYRDAVLNAIVAVFDLIRKRTGLDEDGASLVGRAFSMVNPMLILSTLDSESGRNEQKGFIQILQGTYLGIRNPKAHSLTTDLTEDKAIQYLVFASLLARRVDEARLVKPSGKAINSGSGSSD